AALGELEQREVPERPDQQVAELGGAGARDRGVQGARRQLGLAAPERRAPREEEEERAPLERLGGGRQLGLDRRRRDPQCAGDGAETCSAPGRSPRQRARSRVTTANASCRGSSCARARSAARACSRARSAWPGSPASTCIAASAMAIAGSRSANSAGRLVRRG